MTQSPHDSYGMSHIALLILDLLSELYFSDKGRRLSDFTLGNFIAKGSYGAVFNAKLKSNFETDSDFNCSKEFDKKCNLGTFSNFLSI